MVINLGTFMTGIVWLLIILKVSHVIDISWTLILLPVWISFGIVTAIALAALFIVALAVMRGV